VCKCDVLYRCSVYIELLESEGAKKACVQSGDTPSKSG
jgi:hypothetical protein